MEGLIPEFDFDLSDIQSPEPATPAEQNNQVEQSSQENQPDNDLDKDFKQQVINLGFGDEESNTNSEEPEEQVSQNNVETQPSEEVPQEDANELFTQAVYNTMVEFGYWNQDADFKGTVEELNAKFEKMPEQMLDNIFNSMPEPMVKLLEYGHSKGSDLDYDDLSSFFSDYIKPSEINEVLLNEDVDTQREYLMGVLIDQGNTKEEADDIMDIWESKGTIGSKATSHYAKVRELKAQQAADLIAEQQQAQAEAKQQAKQYQQKLYQTINETEWEANHKASIQDFIFSGKLNEISSNILNHPKALVQLANYLSRFNSETGEIDESVFKAQTFSKETKRVKSGIERNFDGFVKAKALPHKETKPKKNNADHGLTFAD